jgi:hypothetical protein
MSATVRALALAASLAAVAACSPGVRIFSETYPETVEGSGVPASQEWEVGEFHALRVGGSFDAEVEVGPAPALTIECDDNLLELVEVELVDGRLRIGLEKNVRTDLGMRATITTPTLDAVATSGVTELRVANAATDHMEADASGATKITIGGAVRSVTVETSGTSSCGVDALGGGTAVVSASGASAVTIGGAAQDLRVKASGTSRVRIAEVTGGTVEVDLSGATSVKAAGTAEEARVELSGTSGAELGDLSVVRLVFDLSGATRLKAHATGTVSAEASGTSRAEYTGGAQAVRVETSGTATVIGK